MEGNGKEMAKVIIHNWYNCLRKIYVRFYLKVMCTLKRVFKMNEYEFKINANIDLLTSIKPIRKFNLKRYPSKYSIRQWNLL